MRWRIPRSPVARLATAVLVLALALPQAAGALILGPTPALSVPVNTVGTYGFSVTATPGYGLSSLVGGNTAGWSFAIQGCNANRSFCGIAERFDAGFVPRSSSIELGLIECPLGGGGCLNTPHSFAAQAFSTLQRDVVPLAFGDVPFESAAALDVPITVDTGYTLVSATIPFGDFAADLGDCPAIMGPFSCTATLTLAPTISAIYHGNFVVTECMIGFSTCLVGAYATSAHVLLPAPAVPEPASLALLASALLTLRLRRRRR